ncbi:MAG: hypothetical protein K6T83_21830 [Alicyclobacillus sp.]|nr:hypothetical protein [Alicyclobacillus sp.]
MKKWICAMGAMIIVPLAGCGTSSQNTTQHTGSHPSVTANTTKDKPEPKKSKYPFPAGATTTGKGKVVVYTPSGGSDGGKTPVLFVKPDDQMLQIGVDTMDFDGSKQVFLYINKVFQKTVQGGMQNEDAIDLDGDQLKPGVYTVTAVQFQDNDPTKKVTSFHETMYQIKQGH